jgi:hypothetical protein
VNDHFSFLEVGKRGLNHTVPTENLHKSDLDNFFN